MKIRILPGSRLSGQARVPGDKSIAHRLLLLAATARGRTVLHGLPGSLDVRSTARCLGTISPECQAELEAWIARASAKPGGEDGSRLDAESRGAGALSLEGRGREALREPDGPLDCGNSGTSLRLLGGLVAGAPFRTVLTGDDSLRRRPMERLAEPLRLMGARVSTDGGRPPVEIRGGGLRGIRYAVPVPSAQVKGAVLLAGLAAEGPTTVIEAVPTRDHTERALASLGAPVTRTGEGVTVSAFQHRGFRGTIPGDPSSAAFLLAAAAVTGSGMSVRGAGLNPTRLSFLKVMERMGANLEIRPEEATDSLGEPVGDLEVRPGAELMGAVVPPEELPLLIDEVPVLAAVAAHGRSESRFEGAAELRVKESDRLAGLRDGLRGLGGRAEVEGDTLVVGGGRLPGGVADARGDHRLAMALSVAAMGASGESTIGGMEWAEVSFPGFVATLAGLGARVEALP
jgi:3-phosphoshikimate 1-carboxyvinyltransferase